MAYTVFRSDLMSGTNVAADTVSLKFYTDTTSNIPAAVENGVFVKLNSYLEGEREVWLATAATATTPLAECAIVATPEVMYDEHKKNLDEFTNEAGKIARGYIPRSRNIFSITKDGFTGTLPTAAGTALYIGTGGKVTVTKASEAVSIGKLLAIESAGRYTYYVIELA